MSWNIPLQIARLNETVEDKTSFSQLQITTITNASSLATDSNGDIVAGSIITAPSFLNINCNNITINSLLYASGTSVLNGGVSINSLLNVSGGTNLTGNLTMNNGNINMNNGKVENFSNLDTNQTLNIRTLGSFDINLIRDVANTALPSVSLKSNEISLNGNVINTGSTTITTNLFVSGISILNNATSVNSSLNVSGNATFNSVINCQNIDGVNLNISGISILNNATSVNSSLNVSGNATFNSVINCQNIDGANIDIGNNATTLNLACSANIQTVNIGSNGSAGITTINIGGTGDTVNIAGSVNNITSQNLLITDKQILLNNGAVGAGTARDAGIVIRDNNNDLQGYIITNATNGQTFNIKAPESTGVLSTPVITSNQVIATTNTISSLSSIYYRQNGGVITGAVSANSSLNVSGNTTLNGLTLRNTLNINNQQITNNLRNTYSFDAGAFPGTFGSVFINPYFPNLQANIEGMDYIRMNSLNISTGSRAELAYFGTGLTILNTPNTQINGATSINSSLNVSKTSVLNGATSINSSLNVNGLLNVSNNTNISGNMTVFTQLTCATNSTTAFTSLSSSRGYGASLILGANEVGTRRYNLISSSTASGVSGGKLAIFDEDASAYRTILSDSNGNMGIGVNNPAYLLHVNGDTNINNNFWYRINTNKVSINLGFSLFIGLVPFINSIRPSGWSTSSTFTRIATGQYTLTLGLTTNTPTQAGIAMVCFQSNGEHRKKVVCRYQTATQIGIDSFNNDVFADLDENINLIILYD